MNTINMKAQLLCKLSRILLPYQSIIDPKVSKNVHCERKNVLKRVFQLRQRRQRTFWSIWKKREKQTNTSKQQRNYHHVKWFNEYNFISLLICRFCRENLNNIKCMFSDLSHSLSCNFISFFGCITFHILLLNINSCNSFIRRAWSKGKKIHKKVEKHFFMKKKKSAQQTFDPCL